MKKAEDNFGIPRVDNTPMGVVDMTGQFYRGVSGNQKGKSVWVRVGAILFSLLLLMIGIFFLVAAGSVAISVGTSSTQMITLIIPTFFGLLFSGVGIKGIFSNIKKQK